MRYFFYFISIFLTTSILANHADWMAQIPNTRVLNQLVIPGTHDAGTDTIISTSKFSLSNDDPLPTWLEKISNFLPVSLVRPIVAAWSKTQPLSIEEQLDSGVRYFDFRVCDFQSHFYFCHALLGTRLKQALQQLREFSIKHPTEIILCDFNHVYNVKNDDDENQLITLLKNNLGDLAVPNTYQPSSTIGDIRASGRNVIIFLSPTIHSTDSIYWSENNMDSSWPNVDNSVDLKKQLDIDMSAHAKNYQNNNQFFVLQAIKTESDAQVINGVIDAKQYPNNIEQYESSVNMQLENWLSDYVATYGPTSINIVMQDWFSTNNQLVDFAIQYDT